MFNFFKKNSDKNFKLLKTIVKDFKLTEEQLRSPDMVEFLKDILKISLQLIQYVENGKTLKSFDKSEVKDLRYDFELTSAVETIISAKNPIKISKRFSTILGLLLEKL
jgi:hypothetical protein